MASSYNSFRKQLSTQNLLNTSSSQLKTRKGSYHLYKQQKLNNISLTNIQPRPHKMTRNISHGDIRPTYARNPEAPTGLKYNFRGDYQKRLNSSILDGHSYDLKQKQPQKILRREYERQGKFQNDNMELIQPLKSKRYETNPLSSQNKYIPSHMENFKVERRPYIKPSPAKSPGKIVQVANRNKTECNKGLIPQIQQFSLGQRVQYYGRMDRKQLVENPSTSNLPYDSIQSKQKLTQYSNTDKSDLYDRIENYQKKYMQRQRDHGVNQSYGKLEQVGHQFIPKRQYIKPYQPLNTLKNTYQDKYSSGSKFNTSLKLRDENLQTLLKKNKQKNSLQKQFPERYNIQSSYKKKDHFHSYNRQSGEVSYKGLYDKMGTIPLRVKQNNRNYEMQRANALNQKGKGFYNYSKERKDGYQKKQYQSWNNLNKQSHQQRFSRLNDYENRLYDQPRRQRIQSTTDLKIPHKYPYIQSMKSSKIHQTQQHHFEDYLPKGHLKKEQQFGLKNKRFNRQQSHQISLMNHPEYNCVNRIEALNNKINSKFNSLNSVYEH